MTEGHEGCFYLCNSIVLNCKHSNYPCVLFPNAQCTFICYLSLLCALCGTLLIVQRRKCFHSMQTSARRTRKKSRSATSYSILCFISRPHIITANLSRHRLAMSAFKAQSKCIYAFDPISLPPLSCCSWIIGITVCRKQSETPDRSVTSQTLFFCLVNLTAPSEEIQLNLSFKERVTAGA